MKSNQRRPAPDVDKDNPAKLEEDPDNITLVEKEAHAESEEAALPNSEDQLKSLAKKLKGTSAIAKFEEDKKHGAEE